MIKPFRGEYTLTQKHGENPSIYARFGLKGHNGIDYSMPNGTDIVAPHKGKIIEASFDPSGYGNYIKIENDKEGSVLAHLQLIMVQVGNVVDEGALIAKSDNTGFSTGSHLHWGYFRIPRNRLDGYLGFIDQLPLFAQTPPPVTADEWKAALQKYNGTFYKPEDVIAYIEARKRESSYKDEVIGEKDIKLVKLQNILDSIKALFV